MRGFRLQYRWAVVSAILPMLFTAAPAVCGTMVSRSAGLVLTATVEGLSVEAVSAPVSAMRLGNDNRVTLKSFWAVPAHTTTIRVSARMAPEAGVATPNAGAVNVFTESAGATNFPVSRMDRVDLVRQAAGAARSGAVQIVVQAP